MNILLDTHALLWFCDGNNALSRAAKTAIEDSENVIHVSHVTAWEVSIKTSLGKLILSVPFKELFPDTITANGFQPLQMDYQHFERLLALPFHHRDPFDRLLIAQALAEEMCIVTKDPHFSAYGATLIW